MYVLAAVEVEATETELFLLAGDSEPRGSRRRLISMMLEVTGLRQGHVLGPCIDNSPSPISGVLSSVAAGARENAGAMQDDHLTTIDIAQYRCLLQS